MYSCADEHFRIFIEALQRNERKKALRALNLSSYVLNRHTLRLWSPLANSKADSSRAANLLL